MSLPDPHDLGLMAARPSARPHPEDVLVKTRQQLAGCLIELEKRATGEVQSRGDDVETEAAVSIALAACVAALHALGPNPQPVARWERSRKVLAAFADRLGETSVDYLSNRQRMAKWAAALAYGIQAFCLVARPDVQIGQQIADWYLREGTLLPGTEGPADGEW